MALLLAAALACGDDDGAVADGGVPCIGPDCADPVPEAYACQTVLDASGRPPDPGFLEALRDPVAQIVLKRPGACPSTHEATIDKLQLEVAVRCAGGARAGMTGRLISERAQLLGVPDVMRAVVSRQCASRPSYGLMISVPTMDANNPVLPQHGIGLMGYDNSSDQFNFYSLTGDASAPVWSFHGSSLDLIAPRTTSECARCHSDGGLVMRELVAPWLHWESGARRTPGAAELIDRFEELGARGAAADLEVLVRAGNRRWNASRIAYLRDEDGLELHAGSTAALLRPLFCGTSYNLASAATPDAGGDPTRVDAVPAAFLADPFWEVGGTIPIGRRDYTDALAAVGSRVEGVLGPIDTFFGLTVVVRAASDQDYVAALIDEEIVDAELVADVLAIDVTRPVFSEARCGLLEFAPDFVELDSPPLPPDPPETGGADEGSCCTAHPDTGCADLEVQACICMIDPECCTSGWDQICVNRLIDGECGGCPPLAGSPKAGVMRRAIVARLVAADPAAGTAAALLLEHLITPDQRASHAAAARRFVEACEARASVRDPRGFIDDLLNVVAARRQAAILAADLLETPAVVATDDLQPPATTRLDPTTCELRVD